MAFRIEIQPQALEDLDLIAAHIKFESNFVIAEKWFKGIMGDIASLRELPARCAVASESKDLG